MQHLKQLIFMIAGAAFLIFVGCSAKETNNSVSDEQPVSSNTVAEENKVDIDLTEMNLNMVYSSLYQMLETPKDYIGKVVKMKGTYYPGIYKETNMVYHYCIVEDEMACCAQGIEFVWDDGSHVYPDEYPNEYDVITVTGTFETYTEPESDYVYCRLANTTLERE